MAGTLGLLGQSVVNAPVDPSKAIVAIPSLSARITPLSIPQAPAGSGAAALLQIVNRSRNAARPGSDPTPASIEQEIAELETYTADHPDSPYTPESSRHWANFAGIAGEPPRHLNIGGMRGL